ncbi:cytochrome P450 [Ganoderma sinense ZZ0214-1]|uniref:Cytochrome P450 n=1 Tax=Ganoderma sinense ZZ0214-1 TaxID=1077348 RepID=A0A2G8SC56_9APHY|nr:cytochrome P450 [Ganoderma sinense ZZ0214-1]
MALEDPQALILAGVAILAALYVVRWKTNPLNPIPTVGGSGAPGLAILTALNFWRNGKELLEEGYQKYYGTSFKVAFLDKWLVVVSGAEMLDELRRRPDEEVSFLEGAEETVQMRYTVGPELMEDPYHVDIIKEKLTRTLPLIMPDVVDELEHAVAHYIKSGEEEWAPVSVMTAMQQIVARASSRVFVGVPLCRNQEYLDMSIRFTRDVSSDRLVMNRVPRFLKPLVGPLLSKTNETLGRAMPHIQPVINERRANLKELGDNWLDKPNDMLQWILEEGTARNHSDMNIVKRIFLVNFAAIHTSSTSITHALYDLAAMPECIPALREEIESIVATDGWTKAAMGKMWKLDSLFRESLRYHGIGLTSLTRKVMKDITLSDGTFLPKGTLVVAAAHSTHHDEANYQDAEAFDPFRFAKMREAEGESLKYQFVNTSLDYISFGHGRHACPGRFFAANELKALLAYIVVNYDMKLGGDGKRPASIFYGTSVIPSPTGQVLFRKRQTVSS